MKTPRTWFVEDIHDQTGLYIKAYKRKQPGTVEVKEQMDQETILVSVLFKSGHLVRYDVLTPSNFKDRSFVNNLLARAANIVSFATLSGHTAISMIDVSSIEVDLKEKPDPAPSHLRKSRKLRKL